MVEATTESKSNDIINIEDYMFDPDDPNYKDPDLLRKFLEAYNDLPEGWSKNLDPSKGPPFIHVDGRTSYRHPSNRLRKLLDEADKEEQRKKQKLFGTTQPEDQKGGVRKDTGRTSREKRLLKKYRMMVASGVPLRGVEDIARLEGIDPALIMTSSEKEGTAVGEGTTNRPQIPEVLKKKYIRMLKSGVPKGGVETTARIDGVDPSLIENLFTTIDEARTKSIDNNSKVVDSPNEKDGSLRDSSDRDHQSSKCEPFKVCSTDNSQVEFPADATKGAHLSLLVRKLVQTVTKRGGRGTRTIGTGGNVHGNKNGCFFTVDSKDLYNALGAFRGVQYARDMYNSTCSTKDDYDNTSPPMSETEIRSKRKPFLEHLSTLGIRSPTKKNYKLNIDGLDELILFIEEQNKAEIDAIKDNEQIGMYTFDSLSELYKPGSRVVATNAFTSGIDMLCEVSWTRYEQGKTLFGVTRSFKACFQFIAAVGEHYTMCEFIETIENFDGRKSCKSLQFVPLSAYTVSEVNHMKELFRKRGEMYSLCATEAKFLAYTKGSFYAKSGGSTTGYSSSSLRAMGQGSKTAAPRTNGRIMVDTQGSYEAGHSLSFGYDPMILGIKYKYKEYMLHMRALKKSSHAGDVVSNNDTMILFDTVPVEYLEMTWPAVVGFSFTSKAWGDVLVDGLSEIQFQEDAFDKLVLPPAKKRMVKALVRHSNDSFNDIISGKGEGSVFLLYGPPGVGKTLTAEAISEMLHRPLYNVSLGQLGTTPNELETKLNEILDLCCKWDALILLDEADIFLEKRTSSSSLERNAMVSIMLRLVEYFKGVLFLTSNRVDVLDPAFKTRITLAMRYDELNESARNQIWMNLLKASGATNIISDEGGSENEQKQTLIDTKALAKYNLNGREIKNSIRLALALAKEDIDSGHYASHNDSYNTGDNNDTPVLSQEMIIETVEILSDFNEKMNSASAY